MTRNPYLMLGIPFGASRDEATAAFVRRAKPLRRAGAAGTDQLTELTWALNQIDVTLARPAEAMELYRIPASPEAFETGGPGLLDPAPETLAAVPADRDRALLELRQTAAREFLCELVRLHTSRVGRFAP